VSVRKGTYQKFQATVKAGLLAIFDCEVISDNTGSPAVFSDDCLIAKTGEVVRNMTNALLNMIRKLEAK
jgi:hypothetical protein